MLTDLHVKNIALIDDIDLEFEEGLNILTGETGAGKSLLLGSVNLALGKKMSSDMIGKFGDYALVEMIFHPESQKLLESLKEDGVEAEDGQIILTRKIMDKKSICRINGETCTIGKLKDTAARLIDIHGQHEHQSLLDREHQLELVDNFAGDDMQKLLKETKAAYSDYGKIKKELGECNMNEEQRLREIDFLRFEIDEIEAAGLQNEEEEDLEQIYRRMTNAKDLTDGLSKSQMLLTGDGSVSAGELISEAARILNGMTSFGDDEINRLNTQIIDLENLIGDLCNDIQISLEHMSFSQEEFDQVQQRLNEINRLKGKYGRTISDILAYADLQKEKLASLETMEERKIQLEASLLQAENKLLVCSDRLHQRRLESAGRFSQAIAASLKELNFLQCEFKIDVTKNDHYRANGMDHIEFFISTNPGEPLRPLAKVVSGGELSRIMLAIKSLMADQDDTEVMIFDEIDTGISGRTAQKVSEKMASIAKNRQVICITHLPQIASMADVHFEITKKLVEDHTETVIRKLDEDASIGELARILGGSEVTKSVIDSAREMREMAKHYKSCK